MVPDALVETKCQKREVEFRLAFLTRPTLLTRHGSLDAFVRPPSVLRVPPSPPHVYFRHWARWESVIHGVGARTRHFFRRAHR